MKKDIFCARFFVVFCVFVWILLLLGPLFFFQGRCTIAFRLCVLLFILICLYVFSSYSGAPVSSQHEIKMT